MEQIEYKDYSSINSILLTRSGCFVYPHKFIGGRMYPHRCLVLSPSLVAFNAEMFVSINLTLTRDGRYSSMNDDISEWDCKILEVE